LGISLISIFGFFLNMKSGIVSLIHLLRKHSAVSAKTGFSLRGIRGVFTNAEVRIPDRLLKAMGSSELGSVYLKDPLSCVNTPLRSLKGRVCILNGISSLSERMGNSLVYFLKESIQTQRSNPLSFTSSALAGAGSGTV
jgi:hypothetical protein